MTYVAPAVAEKMDRFFLLAQEKDNLVRKLEKTEGNGRDNLKVVYRRLIGNLDRRLLLVRAEIDSLEFALSCSSCTLSE
jgi:hypothetical protein